MEFTSFVLAVVIASSLGSENIVRRIDLGEAVMVLPAGVNKATGLATALDRLRLSPDDTVGVGDAENDLDFLTMCGCAVAVANALPAVRAHVDLVTRGDQGAGVAELIDRIVGDGLCSWDGRRGRHRSRSPGQ